ncbi:MAG TPA: FliH/SctL family protein [Terracidiphilus sp.]|nr:FliH/SctL family protein [Terracidiphilus sp.]
MPFAALQYPDIANGSGGRDPQAKGMDPFTPHPGKRRAEVEMTEAELAARVRQERADAAAQAEQKLRQEYEQKLIAARSPLASSLKEFAAQRDDYFARVEAEVVQLSLSIAAKILHREAQVDPMLVATLVRMAVEKMREESSVTIRVGAGRASAWKQFFAATANAARIAVVEDAQLTDQDCLLETELGTANFGLDSQLKEVEQGFFDLLALRPGSK